MSDQETPMTESDALDELPLVAARARLLELALLGAEGSGMTIDRGPYADALRQGACDVANGLTEINEALFPTIEELVRRGTPGVTVVKVETTAIKIEATS